MVTLHLLSAGELYQVPKLAFLSKLDISSCSSVLMKMFENTELYGAQVRCWSECGVWPKPQLAKDSIAAFEDESMAE